MNISANTQILGNHKTERDIFGHALATTMRALAQNGRSSSVRGSLLPEFSEVRQCIARLPEEVRQAEIAEVRGTADSLALKCRYHDAGLHLRLMPAGKLARAVFNAIEQARFEALGALAMPGVRANLAALARKRAVMLTLSPRADGDVQALPMVLGLMVRERLTGDPPPDACREIVENRRGTLEQKIGHLLDSLAEHAMDQEGLSLTSLRIIAALIRDVVDARDADPESAVEAIPQGEEVEIPDPGPIPLDEVDSIGFNDGEEEAGDPAEDIQIGDIDDDGAEPGKGHQLGNIPWWPDDVAPPAPGKGSYRIFTDRYDVVIRAEELCDVDEMTRLRNQLDRQMVDMSGAICKLANRLQRRLLAFQRLYWRFDLDEGVLDTERLSRVITSPQSARFYKVQSDIAFKDTVVTLLLDNSGSMRGKPILTAATVADVLARTLERCSVKVEILGFTTNAWGGGRSIDAWHEAGKPDNPGRLNDLLHIVYKSADTPWRKARRNLGLMMREGLLKENVDGESLLWAHGRLLRRSEERRILMVISDGAPVDDSTLTANSRSYLEDHLQRAIDWIEARSPIELNAIGIGHDVTRFYRAAETIADVDQLAAAMTERLAALFETTPPRPRQLRMSAGT